MENAFRKYVCSKFEFIVICHSCSLQVSFRLFEFLVAVVTFRMKRKFASSKGRGRLLAGVGMVEETFQ